MAGTHVAESAALRAPTTPSTPGRPGARLGKLTRDHGGRKVGPAQRSPSPRRFARQPAEHADTGGRVLGHGHDGMRAFVANSDGQLIHYLHNATDYLGRFSAAFCRRVQQSCHHETPAAISMRNHSERRLARFMRMLLRLSDGALRCAKLP